MTKIIINERVQEALEALMSFSDEGPEWCCFTGHEKECLGTFDNECWIVDEEEEIKFLRMFIEMCTKELYTDEDWDYKHDCVANIGAAATLLEAIMDILCC